jgi:hypothetical protein
MNQLQEQLIAAEIKLAGANRDLADMVQLMVENSVKFTDDGSVEIHKDGVQLFNNDASEMTISDLIDEIKREKPLFFFNPVGRPQDTDGPESRPAADLPKELENNVTARMMATIANQKASAEHTKRERARKLAEAGNPWKKDGWNVTSQMTIMNGDPDLAGRLKQEASR